MEAQVLNNNNEDAQHGFTVDDDENFAGRGGAWLAFSQLSGAGFWIQFRGVFRRILVVKLISNEIELKSLKIRY